jgi:hypothetical protein
VCDADRFIAEIQNTTLTSRARLSCQASCVSVTRMGGAHSHSLGFIFLGVLVKLRKATAVSFLMSVRPSAWNNSASPGRIFMKFDICGFFEHFSGKIQVSLKSDTNNVRTLYMKQTDIHF